MKSKTIFLMIFGVWFADFLSTFFILNFFDGFRETSKIPAYFFSLGWYGWVLCPLLCFFILFIFLLFACECSNWANNKKEGLGFMILYLPSCFYFISELFVIYSNLSLVFW